MHYKFIDIGCGHSNVSVDVYGLNVHGLLVDPIQEFCNVLPSSSTVLKECAAITTYDGTLDMNVTTEDLSNVRYFPISALRNKKHFERIAKRYGVYGMEFISTDATKDTHNYEWLKSKRTVQCMTLKSLLNKYDITEVDQFKIDVEGHENVLLSQLIDLIRLGEFKVNEKIIFEYNYLSDKKVLDELIEIISKEFGFDSKFQVVGLNEDMVMTKIKE